MTRINICTEPVCLEIKLKKIFENIIDLEEMKLIWVKKDSNTLGKLNVRKQTYKFKCRIT